MYPCQRDPYTIKIVTMNNHSPCPYWALQLFTIIFIIILLSAIYRLAARRSYVEFRIPSLYTVRRYSSFYPSFYYLLRSFGYFFYVFVFVQLEYTNIFGSTLPALRRVFWHQSNHDEKVYYAQSTTVSTPTVISTR